MFGTSVFLSMYEDVAGISAFFSCSYMSRLRILRWSMPLHSTGTVVRIKMAIYKMQFMHFIVIFGVLNTYLPLRLPYFM